MRAWHLEALGVPDAWQQYQTRGAGVKVAILDSGVTDIEPLAHVQRFDSDGTCTSSAHDVSSDAHGTQTASLLAARDDRLPGIAPDCECLAFCVADINGDPLPSLVANALRCAIDLQVDLICCPFTLVEASEDFAKVLASVRKANIPLIVAAGNESRSVPAFPLEAHAVVTVGATNDKGRLVSRFRWEGWMQVSAPGLRVPTWTGRGDISKQFSGTSAATPLVAGAVALGLAHAKALDASGKAALALREQLADVLQRSSQRPEVERQINPLEFLAEVSALIDR